MIYVNGEAVNTTRFPDNTSQVWKLPINKYKSHVSVVWTYSHEAEVLELAQLKAILNQNNLTADLDITFLPYARQDKEISNDTTFGLTIFAEFLNRMRFDAVAIQDPHSQVALDLIDRSYAYYPHKEVEKVFMDTKSDFVCYPDEGASKKYGELYPFHFIKAEKKRDQSTGAILGTTVLGPVAGYSILIVDDICDGGATFKFLAQKLIADGAKEVNLFVTHGLFTKGLRPLKESGITNVYTPKGIVLKSHFQESY